MISLKYGAHLTKIFIGCGVVISLFALDFSLSRTLELIKIDLMFVLGLIFFAFANCIKYLRLLIFTSHENDKQRVDGLVNLRASFQGFLTTGLLILILPFKLGEIFRVGFVAKFLEAPTARAVLIVSAERFLDLTILCGLCLTFITFISPQDVFRVDYVIIIIVGIATIFLLLLTVSKVLIAHYETKYWDKPRSLLPQFFGQRLLDWSIIKYNVTRNFYAIITLTFCAWIFEITSVILIFSKSGLLLNELILLAFFCLFGFSVPSGPAGIGGVHLAFYTFNRLINENFDINHANIYIIYTHITLVIFLILTSVWKLKYEDNT